MQWTLILRLSDCEVNYLNLFVSISFPVLFPLLSCSVYIPLAFGCVSFTLYVRKGIKVII
jgi:hypothetical protein